MKACITVALFVFAAGCAPEQRAHEQEIRAIVEKAGGSSVILAESRKLFTSLTNKNESIPFLQNGRWLDDFPAIRSLGDVFHYTPKSSSVPERISIRHYNSHSDTYFVELLNPEQLESSQPDTFRQIIGNIGFIELGGAANGSQPIRSEANSTPSAAGSRR